MSKKYQDFKDLACREERRHSAPRHVWEDADNSNSSIDERSINEEFQLPAQTNVDFEEENGSTSSEEYLESVQSDINHEEDISISSGETFSSHEENLNEDMLVDDFAENLQEHDVKNFDDEELPLS